jgi:hypothetical protein
VRFGLVAAVGCDADFGGGRGWEALYACYADVVGGELFEGDGGEFRNDVLGSVSKTRPNWERGAYRVEVPGSLDFIQQLTLTRLNRDATICDFPLSLQRPIL